MRAVVRRHGKLIVDEMEAPKPGPGQLLARSLVCGICGSDLHMLDHYDHMIDLTTRLGGVSQMRKGADTVFGHEFCCEVLESSGGFKAGDVVVSLPVLIERPPAPTPSAFPATFRAPSPRSCCSPRRSLCRCRTDCRQSMRRSPSRWPWASTRSSWAILARTTCAWSSAAGLWAWR